MLFLTAVDYKSPFESYKLRVKCVELGRPTVEVLASDRWVAESYHESLLELRRAKEEELRRAREEAERRRREAGVPDLLSLFLATAGGQGHTLQQSQVIIHHKSIIFISFIIFLKGIKESWLAGREHSGS